MEIWMLFLLAFSILAGIGGLLLIVGNRSDEDLEAEFDRMVRRDRERFIKGLLGDGKGDS